MTCDDCIHGDLCLAMEAGHGLERVNPPYCGYFKDATRFKEIPCKVGDKLYFVGQVTGSIQKFMYHDTVTKVGVTVRGGIAENGVDISSIGETVFLTEAEAKEALETK